MAEETGDLEEAARCYTEGTRSSGMLQTYTHMTNINYNNNDRSILLIWRGQAICNLSGCDVNAQVSLHYTVIFHSIMLNPKGTFTSYVLRKAFLVELAGKQATIMRERQLRYTPNDTSPLLWVCIAYHTKVSVRC